jgi:hypothetical protein
MSTETPAVVEPQGEPTNTPTPTAPPAPAAPAQETDWKAEARKWESRAKENSEATKRLAEIEEASKSEAQKLADRAAAAEAKVAQFESEKQQREWVKQVAEATGVPAAALRGSTLEDIQAHADSLKSLISQEPPAPRGPIVPSEGTTNGNGREVSQLSKDDLKSMTPEQVQAARKSGRLNRVLGIS